MNDTIAIKSLIKKSSITLGLSDYSSEQIRSALTSAWGLDTQLIKDQSYFVIETASFDGIVGCGGWSFRQTLFGHDDEKNRSPKSIDPATDAAKIRAFFVDPEYSRKGIGTLMMQYCEQQALKNGFTKMELMATLSGLKLYEKHGYHARKSIHYPLTKNLSIKFVPMYKLLELSQ